MHSLESLRFVGRALALNRVSRAEPSRVAALQRRRLEDLVRFAVGRSPFYRRKYQGIDLGRFQLADLPPTSKGELMAHFDEVVTDGRLRSDEIQGYIADPGNVGKYYLGRYVLSHTSGSQGQPIVVVQERRGLELLFLMQMTRGNATGRSGLREAIRNAIRPARLAVIILERGFYPSGSTFAHIPEVIGAIIRVRPLSMTDPDLVEKLNEFRPTILSGFANVLARLAAEAEAGRLRIAEGLRHVVNHSETLGPAARQRLLSVFGVPVLNNYATAECPFLSNGCSTGPGAHVNADWVIVEVVDEHNRPVPDGAPGKKVLVTNLANTVQPFIRYEINDVVTLAAEPCRCGSRLPRIASIDGRGSDEFTIHDGRRYRAFSPFVFKKALLHAYEVREWQAVQYARNAFKLRLELLPEATLDVDRVRHSLERHLEMYNLTGLIRYHLEVVPALEANPETGKFKNAVSLIGPPTEGLLNAG